MSRVRVRFAPSPTGFLHLGGARTALFNWLLARKTRGTFVLRVEDTDARRSSQEMAEGIMEGLSWLGLDWDEGPFYQSRRLEIYREAAKRTVASRHAYTCFCSPEEIQARSAESRLAGRIWRCRRCRNQASRLVRSRVAAGESHTLRFRVPADRRIVFRDQVYGKVSLSTENIEDFTLLRSDGSPTYHLSVVADDWEMGISHVIRGADHLSNTPKQILLHEALGTQAPGYAHLPLILGPDKKRLSKRNGAESVLEYRDQGVLPMALCNYLALLGWSPGDDRELFSNGELVKSFDLDRVNKANAVFDRRKLDWMNSRYLAGSSSQDLVPHLQPFLERSGYPEERGNDGRLLPVIRLLKSRLNRLSDFPEMAGPFLTDDFDYESKAVNRHFSLADPEQRSRLRSRLEILAEEYDQLQEFNLENVEAVLRGAAKESGFKIGVFFGAVRVALTGRTASPGIFDVIVTLGRQRVVERLTRCLKLLQ